MQDTAVETSVLNIPVSQAVKVSDVEGLADAIREYIKWQKAATEAEANKKRLREILDKARGVGGVITYNGVEVVFDKPNGERLDTDTLKLKYPAVYADCKKPTTRFTVVSV